MFKAVVHLFSVFQIYSLVLYLFFNIERSPPAISRVEKKGNSLSIENNVENDVVFSNFSTFNSIKVENVEKRNEKFDSSNVEMLKYSLTFRKKMFSLMAPQTVRNGPGERRKIKAKALQWAGAMFSLKVKTPGETAYRNKKYQVRAL